MQCDCGDNTAVVAVICVLVILLVIVLAILIVGCVLLYRRGTQGVLNVAKSEFSLTPQGTMTRSVSRNSCGSHKSSVSSKSSVSFKSSGSYRNSPRNNPRSYPRSNHSRLVHFIIECSWCENQCCTGHIALTVVIVNARRSLPYLLLNQTMWGKRLGF